MERIDAIVETPSGKLQGSFERSFLGDNYYAFKGIPYAKPPIGQLRFRDPQPLEPWTGIRDASSHGPISAQYDYNSKRVIGSEDCLYLNVYTRNLNSSSPVMFWIHGGGYYFGSGNDDMFGPDYFLKKDVVLVTINYRLAVFGFLDLRDKMASGNQGLKDQVMALKWVKNNISSFDGDPNNVTIFGGSSGAAAVHYLTMSKMAEGLFHKAICQSGTALCSSMMARIPKKTDLSQFLERLDCQEKDPTAILDYLKNVNFERLVEVQVELRTSRRILQGRNIFLPTVDDKSDEPFMPMSSLEAATQGIQVPLMIGYNEMEGLLVLNESNKELKKLGLENVDQHLEDYTSLVTYELLQSNNLTLKDLRHLYFKNEAISEKTVINTLKYYGDLIFIENIHRLVKIQMHTSSAATYLYKLSYDKNLSLSKMKMDTTIEGPNHGDELMYLFRAKICDDVNLEQLQKGTGGDVIMRQMVELWTNFAKTGRPTLEISDLLSVYWLPVNNDVVLRYLNIDHELRMEKMLNLEQHYSYKKKFV